MHILGKISTLRLLISIIIAGPECISASSNSTQQIVSSVDRKQNYLLVTHPAEACAACTSLPVLVDTKAVLSCPFIMLTNVIMTTWEITLGDKPLCMRKHRRDTNEIIEINCTDEKMTWPDRPDQIPALQIDPVAITHEGYYMCAVVTPDGNFQNDYHLRVLAAPEMTLFQSENRTAVCKAAAGRPAARISWTPAGDCVPEHKDWGNGTVTVQSTCHWADGNVSIVSCSVSHETGNWSRSIELNQVSFVGRKQNHLSVTLPTEANTSLPVLVDTKAVLSCPPIPLTNALLTTWEITLGNKPPCIRTHRRNTNETIKTNCTDKRMTWPYRPDKIAALQIDPVAITHEGYYRCEVAAPDGNFQYNYHLRVLAAPEMTLFQSENRTAVCKAAAGRPAAQISWTPEGDCVPEHKDWGNGTVSVQSTCHWADGSVSIVSCSVSHETGNWSRSIELTQGVIFPVSQLLIILYLKSSIFLVVLVIVGIIYFQRINGCRAQKNKNLEVNLNLMRYHKNAAS